MGFVRHIIGLVIALLFSTMGTSIAIALPQTATDLAFTQAQTAHFPQADRIGFTARAPPTTVANVAVTGDVTVMHGGAFVTHDAETQRASLSFGADHIATNRTGFETSNGALVRPADSPNYSVATEVQLPTSAYPGVSRQRHNQISNQALHEAFEADPAYAAQMENLYPGIVDGVRPGPRGAFPRSAPTSDVTWHHGTQPGQMQLVPIDQHTASGPVQGSLHPNGSGGFADWGTE